MDALRPPVAELLVHVAASEGQPWPVEPYAVLVWTGNPDHHRGGIHYRTESRVKPARGLDRNIGRIGWWRRTRQDCQFRAPIHTLAVSREGALNGFEQYVF